jgi:hypothetical protein
MNNSTSITPVQFRLSSACFFHYFQNHKAVFALLFILNWVDKIRGRLRLVLFLLQAVLIFFQPFEIIICLSLIGVSGMSLSSLALSEVWVQRSGLHCSSITADNIFTQIKKKLGKEI